MIYILILIIFIIIFFLTRKDKFWKELPVSNRKIKYSGYITNNINVDLKYKKYNTYLFNPNRNFNYIINFINLYSDYLKNDNIHTDIELFKYENINSKSLMNNFLVLYQKKKIIGIIVNTPCDLYFYNNIIETNKINYIVIHNNYNYNTVFSILFSNNIEKNIYNNYKSFIFSRDKIKYPFNYLCKCRYYTKDLYYTSKNNLYNSIQMYKNDNNSNKIFDFYNHRIKSYKVYKIFKKDDFNRMFNTIIPIVYCFHIQNNNIVNSICILKRIKNVGIIQIVLSDNIIDFIENICFICKNLGMTTIKCLDIMNNKIFIDKLNFNKSYFKYYHMFNYHINYKILPSDFAFF